MAHISPLEPQPRSINSSSVVLYNKGPTPSTTDDVDYAIQQKIPHSTEAVASIAQFVNPTTEQAEQKWLLCFNSAEEATIFYERKQWVSSALETPRTTLRVRLNKGPDTPNVNNSNQARRGARGTLQEGSCPPGWSTNSSLKMVDGTQLFVYYYPGY